MKDLDAGLKNAQKDLKMLQSLMEQKIEEQREFALKLAMDQRALSLKMAEDNQQQFEALRALIESASTRQKDSLDHDPNSASGAVSFNCSMPSPRKLNFDFPRFDGTNAISWIFNADQYFNYYNTPEQEKLAIASIHMDKGTVPWYQMMQRNQPFTSWFELKRAIEIKFGPSLFDCPRAALFKLTQKGSVADYYSEFIALANRSEINPPEALVDCFVSGLKADIKRDVIAQCPGSLIRAISLAKLFEEKYTTNFRHSFGSNANRITSTPNNSLTPKPDGTSKLLTQKWIFDVEGSHSYSRKISIATRCHD
ncbi:uncharacterized protein LOC110265382 [Arachis ipaensis]|uniref:uncharacterized protein LOC110265382 n=1 Tax=Arachis ipaensis TaxID=130454 RepID=UPI000A2B3B08|nr:uncharacterized protein LOC110265382 [Arachis ipaensis]